MGGFIGSHGMGLQVRKGFAGIHGKTHVICEHTTDVRDMFIVCL